MNEERKKLIGERLKLARKLVGLTQSEVADRLDIKRNSYSQIEIGRNALSIDHLMILSEVLEKPVNYLLGFGTDELSGDELELVELYRSLPDGSAREYILEMMRGLADRVAGHGEGEV